jgi:hypothetical protein
LRYRKLGPNNDYSFGNGQLDFYNNVPNAVGQAVETGLMLWLGEWYLDNTLGTPYIQGVFGKHSQSTADGTIQNQVINTQGVIDISSYQSTLNDVTRAFSVRMTIDTIYGPTEVQIENYALY